MPYRVERSTSTRASADPGSPDFDRWVEFREGAVVEAFPEHVRVADLLASGAVIESEAAPARPRKKARA